MTRFRLYPLYWHAVRSGNRRMADAIRRDHNRILQGLRPIYGHLYGVHVTDSEFEPDLIRDTEFVEEKVEGGIRRVMIYE